MGINWFLIIGGLIPSYLLIKSLGLIETIGIIILPDAASMYNIIVCRTFFQGSIPNEFEESAKSDGASNLRLIMKMILPCSASMSADIVKYVVISIVAFLLIVIYPFMQRYFIKGVMIGSLKG